MSSFNKVILMGNLTRDPEARVLAGGASLAKLGVAVNRKWTDANGQAQEEVTFVDVDFFGRPADTIIKYLTKGSSILIEGRLKLDQWQDRDTGANRQRLGVVGERFTFVGGRSASAEAAAESAGSQGAALPPSGPGSDDDDVPF